MAGAPGNRWGAGATITHEIADCGPKSAAYDARKSAISILGPLPQHGF
jgi:hypothetical protein